MKGYQCAVAAVVAAIMIGGGVPHFRCLGIPSPEKAGVPTADWAATFAGCPCGDAAPRPESAPSTPAPAAKRQVVVKSNDQCYVCHMPFLKERLAAVHAKLHVWCGTCHGPSVPHIEDEYIGATPPDIVFKKDKVDRMCGQCHDPEEHSVVAGKLRRARLAESQKAQRKIKGRKIKVTGVCTDCHGSHWTRPPEQPEQAEKSDGKHGTGSAARP